MTEGVWIPGYRFIGYLDIMFQKIFLKVYFLIKIIF